jgi:cbb3-type cytochrome c oxidase subunit III
MKYIARYILICLFSSLAHQLAYSEDNLNAAKNSSVEKGAVIAAGTCAACHGTDGIALVPSYPNLAGQHKGYIEKQLNHFKSGTRVNAIMNAMAAPLSAEDISNVSEFYEAQSSAPGNPINENLFNSGRKLFAVGDRDRGIPACSGCHSPNGKGIYPNYPSIAGQSATYSSSQLMLFKRGERINTMMQTVAKRLTDADMEALAAYTSSLN